jgi:hypothetical protein
MTPCGSWKNRPSEERIASIIWVTRIGELEATLAVTGNRFLCSVLRLPVIVDVVRSPTIPITLTMEVIHFSETSVLTRATRRKIPEDGIVHSHRREYMKSYTICYISKTF